MTYLAVVGDDRRRIFLGEFCWHTADRCAGENVQANRHVYPIHPPHVSYPLRKPGDVTRMFLTTTHRGIRHAGYKAAQDGVPDSVVKVVLRQAS